MVGKSVQFGLQQAEQLLDCALVSTAPGAEQLGDLLSRGCGVIIRALLDAVSGGEKNCAVVAGLRRRFRFST